MKINNYNRVRQNKIPQHENRGIYAAYEYFCTFLCVYSAHIFSQAYTYFCYIYLTFCEVVQQQIQNSTAKHYLTDRELPTLKTKLLKCCMSLTS